jgi:HPt (histidine-containing phosphotransfer) domain-containing protein
MTIIANHTRAKPQPPPVLPPASTTHPAILNIDVFRDTVQEMGSDFVDRLASRLLAEVETLIPELAELAQKGAHDAAAKAAHRTAGAAAAIGLAGLHGALSRYESAARSGDDAAMEAALTTARAALPRTILELREHGLPLNLGTAVAQ